MELTTQQIYEVKKYIDSVLNYDDLKLEVLDHFVSDIESLLAENVLFEDAFLKVKLKWKRQMQQTYNYFYFGSMLSAPRIVMDKAKLVFKNYFIFFLLLYFTPIVLMNYFNANFSTDFGIYVNNGIKLLIIFSLFIYIFSYLSILFSKKKTVYGFIIKAKIFFIAFLIIPLLANTSFNINKTNANVMLIFAIVGIYHAFIMLIFYTKHLKVPKTNIKMV